MHLYVFRARGGAYGIMKDNTGASLPATLGPWSFLRDIHLHKDDPVRTGLNAQEALRTIEHQGHYLVGPGVLSEES